MAIDTGNTRVGNIFFFKGDNCISVGEALPFLDARSRFAFVGEHGVHHDLVRVLGRVCRVALAPVIADGVGEDGAILVEVCGRDGAPDLWVSLESVLGDSVPEVVRSIGASGAKGAVLGMEGNSIHRVDIRHVVDWWIAMALE